MIKRVFLFFFIPFLPLFGVPKLTKGDIELYFKEILSYHVEHRTLTPTLWQRALGLYVDLFDKGKVYLLESEVEELTLLSQRRLERGITQFSRGDVDDFERAHQICLEALERSRRLRMEIVKEMVFSAEDLQPIRTETYLSYPKTEAKLKNRIRKLLTRALFEEKHYHSLQGWTPADREAILALWERRIRRKEHQYKATGLEGDHFLALHTLKSLSKALDAHTLYFSEDEAAEMRSALVKEFEGVGVVLRETIQGVIIADLVIGSPAYKTGAIQVGDKIVEINGKEAIGMSYEQVLEALGGKEGPILQLGLMGKEAGVKKVVRVERQKVSLSNQRLQVASQPFGEGEIGILTLPSFYEGSITAEKDIRNALVELKEKGPLKGLVIDLRENAGGFLTQAVKVAGLFISKGVIAISKYGGGEIRYLRNLDGKLYFDGPLVILTSKASASAAEIVAQALQDYGTALVVGDPNTYGKGTIQIQTLTDPLATAHYKVTVGRYYTVSGRSTQIEGVKADIVVPTIFSAYKIGERFLEYPLEGDSVPAAFEDPLTDIDYRSRPWFQKNYLSQIQLPQDRWKKMLPTLRENSRNRLVNSEDFALFLKSQEGQRGRLSRSSPKEASPPWGQKDLQLEEAIQIVADMIALEKD